MLNRILFALLVIPTTISSKSNMHVKADSSLPSTVETFTGNYVASDYPKRSGGYDWVAITELRHGQFLIIPPKNLLLKTEGLAAVTVVLRYLPTS